jgi:hypothetical protein
MLLRILQLFSDSLRKLTLANHLTKPKIHSEDSLVKFLTYGEMFEIIETKLLYSGVRILGPT